MGTLVGPSPVVLSVNRMRVSEWHVDTHFPKAGVKNVDEAELKLLASQPLDITVHNVLDFPQLDTLAPLLSRLICQKIQGRGPGKNTAPQWQRDREIEAILGQFLGYVVGWGRRIFLSFLYMATRGSMWMCLLGP